MTRVAVLLAVILTTACAHPKPTLTPAGPVVNTPTGDVDIINLPAWLADDVKVCIEDFPRDGTSCLTVRELRGLAPARLKADQ